MLTNNVRGQVFSDFANLKNAELNVDIYNIISSNSQSQVVTLLQSSIFL